MKDIFTDLYNKVLGFFRQTEKNQEEESTKDVACNRLKFVLMQDRTNLTPELMDRMRKELVELLSRYVEMDKEALELGFEQEGNQMALMLSIPVLRAKDEAEIEATLAKEDEEKAKLEENKEAEPDEASDDTAEVITDADNSIADETDETDTDETGEEISAVSDADETVSKSDAVVTKPVSKTATKTETEDKKVKAVK
ncbi:MAG: cell division topological specificity factor MinE [Candidatus Gastranaerophilaceae bacterium]|nr:cell division topological specificity factor MinE [Candidatus Gastranaerophilaceae bacterium]